MCHQKQELFKIEIPEHARRVPLKHIKINQSVKNH